MAPHWPEEVDVFSEPHSRMKKLVHKYSKMVSTTDFTNEFHMTNLLHNLINVFCEFKAHEEIENILIMRNLKRKLKAACVTSAAVCNCHSDNRLTDMLEMVVHGSRSRWTEKSVKERQKYGHKLQKALEDFTQNFLPHMEEEEEVFQPMLMQYFTYEELKELKAKVIHEHVVSSKQEKYVEDLCTKTPDRKTELVPSYFDRLPDEICEKIFSYLNPQDLCRSSQACHRWNQLTKDASLWTGIYPVHWAAGNWTFHPEPLGGVDGAGEVDNDFMEQFDDPPVSSCLDEDADVDESSSQDDDDGDAKDYDGYEGLRSQALTEVKMLSSLVKHLLPRVGSGVRVADLAYSKGLNSRLVHKILKLCPSMEVLDLTHTQVGDDAFLEYGASSRQSKLRHLDLTNCHNITDQALWSLIGAGVRGHGDVSLESDIEGNARQGTGEKADSEMFQKENTNTCCDSSSRVGSKKWKDENKGDNYSCCGGGRSEVGESVMEEWGDTSCSSSSDGENRDFVKRGCRGCVKHEQMVSRVDKLNIEREELPVHCGGRGGRGSVSVAVDDRLDIQNSVCDFQDVSIHSRTGGDGCCRSSETSSCLSTDTTPSLSADRDQHCHTSSQAPFPCHTSMENSFDYSDHQESCIDCDPVGVSDHTQHGCHPAVHSSEPTRQSDCLPPVQCENTSGKESNSSLLATNTITKPCHQSSPLTTLQAGNTNACDKVDAIPSTTQEITRSSRPLSKLRFLSLNGCYGISDVGLRMLSNAGGTPHLEHLDLSGCVQVTGPSVQQLVSTCGPRLDHSNLFYCDNLPCDPYPSTASGCRNRGCATRFCCSID